MYSLLIAVSMTTTQPSFGHRANGCNGAQASCVSSQGCTSAQASCHGLFGRGIVHRVLHREVFRRNHGCTSANAGCQGQPSAPVKPVAQPMPRSAAECSGVNCLVALVDVQCPDQPDALDEVNTARARRGLRPFLRDGLLCQAAQRCAEFRAANRIAGHTANDFQFVPAGGQAVAAGSGALEPSWGWGSCCTFDDYQTAGAAVVVGNDGKRYMQLFVR